LADHRIEIIMEASKGVKYIIPIFCLPFIIWPSHGERSSVSKSFSLMTTMRRRVGLETLLRQLIGDAIRRIGRQIADIEHRLCLQAFGKRPGYLRDAGP
jgi:hypothetical protein